MTAPIAAVCEGRDDKTGGVAQVFVPVLQFAVHHACVDALILSW